jgi:hypothetical protein
MKKSLIILFYLFISISYSQNSSDENLELALRVCGASYLAWNGSTPVRTFERVILNEIGTTFDDPERFKKISDFINNNNKFLICVNETVPNHRKREHVLKRAIAFQNYSYLNHLAENEDLYSIDLNFYEIVDGKKETLLDYVNMIIADPEKLNDYDEDGLYELRDMFIEMGLKKGSEL